MKSVDTDFYFGLQILIFHGELPLCFSETKDFFFEFTDVALCALTMSAVRKTLAQPKYHGIDLELPLRLQNLLTSLRG